MTFQAKVFSAATVAAVIGLTVAGTIFATTAARRTDERIEQTLVAQAKLAAELLSRSSPASLEGASGAGLIALYEPEATRIGQLLDARVTFITHDGVVVGDSAESEAGVAGMENHARRPEVVDAREHGLGISRRHSDTLNLDMLYVAVPVMHPAIAFVRVAVPLSSIRQQLAGTLGATLIALNIALISALLIGWRL